MPYSIICSSPTEMGNYDSFHHHELYPEPCCLTVEDFNFHDPCDFRSKRRSRPQNVLTDEPRRWMEALFEPGDVIEFRLCPPRSVVETMQPRKFILTTTTKQQKLYRWSIAREIEVVVNKLSALNHGVATWWGVWDKFQGKWSDVSDKAGIPLNIYASANPRFYQGGTSHDDVLLARSLFVDLEHISVKESAAKVAETGLPTPTMIVNSGRGVHLYWRLLEPIIDLAIWSGVQKRLIKLLSSDPAIHDSPRVMRLPGFMNMNSELPTRCSIHNIDPDCRYALNDILHHLPSELPQSKPTNPVHKKSSTTHRSSLSIQGNSSDSLRRANAYADRFEPVEENRNSAAFARTCALVEEFDLDMENAFPLMAKVNAKAIDPLDAGEIKEVVEKAVKYVRKKGKLQGASLGEQPSTQPFHEPTGPVVELQDWRQQMIKARLDSLGHIGQIMFDGSTMGAGKSTADLAAMKQAGKTATFLLTHDACDELAEKLTQDGLIAAAHPPLNASTCLMFGTKTHPGPAQLALKAGLNVGQCVCTGRDKYDLCTYQKQREQARIADHTIATHTRSLIIKFSVCQ